MDPYVGTDPGKSWPTWLCVTIVLGPWVTQIILAVYFRWFWRRSYSVVGWRLRGWLKP